jgi:hypothetical protein
MKRIAIIQFFLLLMLFSGIGACKKDQDTPVETPFTGVKFTASGNLTLVFKELYADQPLQADPIQYVTSSGDTIRYEDLKYYISNVTITNDAGLKTNLHNYKLIYSLSSLESDHKISLSGIPAGIYKSISFLIGVDSVANLTGVHDGDLSPAFGMYWPWNTGYVFYRLTGNRGASRVTFSYDIGGTNNSMKREFSLTGYQLSGTNIGMTIKADQSAFFNTPNPFDLKIHTNNIHNTGDSAIAILKPNIAQIFSLFAVQAQ